MTNQKTILTRFDKNNKDKGAIEAINASFADKETLYGDYSFYLPCKDTNHKHFEHSHDFVIVSTYGLNSYIALFLHSDDNKDEVFKELKSYAVELIGNIYITSARKQEKHFYYDCFNAMFEGSKKELIAHDLDLSEVCIRDIKGEGGEDGK